ncbi:MAG: RpiB/LacA/LacB family sugar-phosphate isomerase [Acidimicrobiales bacterium]
MPSRPPLPETEIRAIVRRVVDSVVVPADAASPPAADVGAGAPDDRGSGDGSRGERIALGSDHGGYRLKKELVVKLGVAGYDVVDCGTDGPDAVDYPDFAHAVACQVADGSCRWGIVIDGAGIGSAMVANKVPGVRAALCYDLSTARNSREHNHANVLTLGAGLVAPGLAWQIVQEWLSVPWGGDRHARRVAKITDIEQGYVGSR